ncbi:hypothetical protein [Gallaecimonas xiamenensis]|uniref:Uncharacterized protein n=1 Tax=Gallaecimonas xiamenensis 3-C-1 TaxID=745411 RepID=K2JQ36_9GAMM|nr:hypothetical protein [Gallaecimonas xiamenensis]EKE76607.1 hypothetical protein B3C1_03400 [Gallaecimonas xiamenensis 3-C-1]
MAASLVALAYSGLWLALMLSLEGLVPGLALRVTQPVWYWAYVLAAALALAAAFGLLVASLGRSKGRALPLACACYLTCYFGFALSTFAAPASTPLLLVVIAAPLLAAARPFKTQG